MCFLLPDKTIHDKIILSLYKGNEVSLMEHPNNKQPYPRNNNFATASLVMGILSLVFLCCAPPLLFLVAGLGILFSCLSKGKHARSNSAKVGLALSASTLAIMSAFLIFICSALLSPNGNSFFRDYLHILTDDAVSDEELYHFFKQYFDNSNADEQNGENFFSGSEDLELPPYFFQQPKNDNIDNSI